MNEVLDDIKWTGVMDWLQVRLGGRKSVCSRRSVCHAATVW